MIFMCNVYIILLCLSNAIVPSKQSHHADCYSLCCHVLIKDMFQ